jgi:biotin carboxylase
MSRNSKDVVLFINSMFASTISALKTYEQKTGRYFTPVVIVDINIQESIHTLNDQNHLIDNHVEVISADFDSPESIRRALAPYEDRLVAVLSQYENSIHEFKKIIPYLPYLQTPSESSLDWATDKKLMRAAFDAYDPTLSPASLHVEDALPLTIEAIERKLSYPIIIKPSGLECSLLVSVANDRRQLESQLHNTFKQLHTAYRHLLKRLEPSVLVEEFMIGDMYSIDAYVTSDGVFRHAPPVKVVTGNKVGFDDFFPYLTITPTGLSAPEIAAANDTVERACRALGLRATTAHTELMHTPNGWRVIEVGPRIGGYRPELYSLTIGLNHIANDIVNRMGITPEIPEIVLNHAAVLQMYAHEEGRLKKVHGLDKIEQLPSFVSMKQRFQEGDMLYFARNNGHPAFEVMLCHKDEAQLQKDLKTIEQVLHIELMAKKQAPDKIAAA